MAEFTRKEFYQLAHECRDFALRLANHDQNEVSRDMCREWNAFLDRAHRYDQLGSRVVQLQKARPITRRIMMATTMGIWLFVVLFVARAVPQVSGYFLLSMSSMLILVLFTIPPAAYGTSVEAIEGRVLVVVDALQDILEHGEMGFTEAAYFNVRDVLREASAELRQQVYLNRVSDWR